MNGGGGGDCGGDCGGGGDCEITAASAVPTSFCQETSQMLEPLVGMEQLASSSFSCSFLHGVMTMAGKGTAGRGSLCERSVHVRCEQCRRHGSDYDAREQKPLVLCTVFFFIAVL